jgi:hypothetical protein
MAVSPLIKTFMAKWQCLCYSKHIKWRSLATQNNHKMAVSLLVKTLTKRQSLYYSEHSQNGSPSATHNTHKMAFSLLLRTLTRPECLCYSEYPCPLFPNGYRHRFSIVLKFECANIVKTSQYYVSLQTLRWFPKCYPWTKTNALSRADDQWDDIWTRGLKDKKQKCQPLERNFY